MKMFRYLSFILLLVFNTIFGFSQNKQDTVLVSKYLTLAGNYRNSNPDSMLFFSEKALVLSRKISADKYLSSSYRLLSSYYKLQENYGKATECILNALRIEEKLKNSSGTADLNNELGNVYFTMEKFWKAMEYYSTALDIYSKNNDSVNIAKLYGRIGRLHGAHEYCEKRTVDQKKVDYTTAINYFKKSIDIYSRHKSEENLIIIYLNLVSIYNRFEMADKALPYVMKAMEYYKKINDRDGIGNSLYSMAITYRKLRQFDKCIDYYKETIRYSIEHNLTEGIQFVYEELSQAYYESGDYKRSRDNYVQYMILRDSSYTLEKSNQIFELETKYQTEKKENQILLLTLEKKRKQLFVYILILFTFLILLGSAFFMYQAKSKAKIAEKTNSLNEQKIKELEKERQLIAAHAVLHGEENERSRLARDLHDGLGGLLSGLKLSLTSMKGNILMPEQNLTLFDHSLRILDTSMKELRRVAHNMMPESLSKFGLKDALNDFCFELGNNKEIEIKFQFYGEEKRLDQNYEVSIYRIAQELINNSIKHAQATQILLQIIQDHHRIHLTVQDNGIGFDSEVLNSSDGTGLANIRSRAESLKGKVDMNSIPGKGTEVNVEFTF